MKKTLLLLAIITGGLFLSGTIGFKQETHTGIVKKGPHPSNTGAPCPQVTVYLEDGTTTEQCITADNTDFEDGPYPRTVELNKSTLTFFGISVDSYTLRSKS